MVSLQSTPIVLPLNLAWSLYTKALPLQPSPSELSVALPTL
jgi:hypothetical protein